MLKAVLAAHAPDAEVWAYGSRVSGGAHEGSDLDLVVRNPEVWRRRLRICTLRDALTESDVPILVEVLDWARLPMSSAVKSNADM